jgi:hypothetical protein
VTETYAAAGASMLAANGLEAGAVDNAELIAHKSAFRSVGGLIADYMIEQLCKRTFR